MVVTQLGSRTVGLSTDVKPTVGNSQYRIFEELNTGNWFVWNSALGAGWQLMGSATPEPGLVPPTQGGAPGTILYSTKIDTGIANLPFVVFTSSAASPVSNVIGAHGLEADTGNWFRWNGQEWIFTASPTAVVGTSTEKGYGTATFSGTGAATSFNIQHGLGQMPTFIDITPGSAAANVSTSGIYVDAASVTSTQFTVKYATAPVSGANNVIIYWQVLP